MSTAPEPDKHVFDAIGLIAEVFAARSINYAIIGGIGVLFRGRARYTEDVDVILQVPQVALPGLLDALSEKGFTIDAEKVIREYVQNGITKFHFGHVVIDWLKPVVPLYARVLSDATPLTWENGLPVRFATPEGLILTKLLAFRAQDQQDIHTLLTGNRDTIDLKVIHDEWAAFASAFPDRTAWLEALIAKHVPARS